jgi:3-oxoacyl-[acyl-carrier-protein] synthase II
MRVGAMAATNPAVVTGLGATTPLGGDAETSWAAVLAGQSGVHSLSNTWAEDYGIVSNFAATLKIPADAVLSPREQRRADPSAQYALIAARQAWADASCPAVAPDRLAVVIGSGIGGLQTMLSAWDTVRDRGARRLMPLTVPMLMPNSPAAAVAIDLGARAGAHSTVSACASGAEAVVMAARLIEQGLADVVVAGGAEAAIHPLTLGSFGKMQALSTRSDSPETASRPYCVTRDGFVMGEGAGVLVIESNAHAQARGARIHALLAGVGSSSDAYDVAPPDPTGQGQLRAMRAALTGAGSAVARTVAHVNAHATATPAGDAIEAGAIVEALAEVLGSRSQARSVPVSATKSMTGHLLGAAGAVESIFTILALRDRLAPPTINIHELDPGVPCHVVRDQPESLPAAGPLAAMNNAFGFGGHNMAVVFATP